MIPVGCYGTRRTRSEIRHMSAEMSRDAINSMTYLPTVLHSDRGAFRKHDSALKIVCNYTAVRHSLQVDRILRDTQL